MTLVVANRIERGIRLIGDSKITDRNAIVRSELTGALKIIILEPRVCVAFSGGINRGIDAIRRLHARQRIALDQRLDPSDVQNLLSEAAQDGGVEFLIATVAPRALMRVRADGAMPADQLWIGDHDAFKTYQRHFHEPTGMAIRAHAESPEEAAFFEQVARTSPETFRAPGLNAAEREDFALAARMQQAMDDVIADPSVPTVDGFAIHVKGDDERGFRYQSRGAQFGGFPQTLTPGVETQLRFGKPASAGGYGYTYFIPAEPGVGAVGIHFPQGRIGALFHPLVEDKPIPYRNVDQREFVSAVKKDYEVQLDTDAFFSG
jgi:hypothetical protein